MAVQELVKLREKYPGAYDDMDDMTLASKLAEKYPQYGDLVERVQLEQQPETQPFVSDIPEDIPQETIAPPRTFGETLLHRGKYLVQKGVVEPAKTFAGGTLQAAAGTADTLDFYSDKLANIIGIPETKNSIFEYLRDNWAYYGNKLTKEGVSEPLAKAIYQGAGMATQKVAELMTLGRGLGRATLPTVGAVEGYKEGGVSGAVTGAARGALVHGAIKGIQALPSGAKYPVAFATGAATTEGTPREKIAEGLIFAGLSAGKSPSKQEFKAAQRKYGVGKYIPKEKVESVYQKAINRFQSIENVTARAKKAGAVILPGENPSLRARGYLGIGQKVESVLKDKTFKITKEGKIKTTGKGLKPILDAYEKVAPEKRLKVKQKELNDYLIARRTVKDLKPRKMVTKKQLTQSVENLQKLKNKYGNLKHLQKTADELYSYQKRILSLLVDSGNISKEQFSNITSQNKNYIPFDRVISPEPVKGGAPVSKKRFTKAKAPIKRIKGSELDIANPIESVIKNTYKIMDIAERNTIAKNTVDLRRVLPDEISPMKATMRPIKVTKKEVGKDTVIFRPSQFEPKGNVLTVYENGKPKYYKVSKNLHQAMTGLNETSSNLVTKVLSQPAKWLRTGATITPEFMLRNPIRDQFTALMQTNFGFKPFYDTLGAMADVVKKSGAYNDWLRSGGAHSGFVEMSRPNLKRIYKSLQSPTGRKVLKKLNIITSAQDISQLFEQATRVGAFKRARKRGLSAVEAGFESREATLDFARRGSQTKDINSTLAFFNAGLQATDKGIRSYLKDPMGFTMKGMATITLPSLLLHAINRNDPDYKNQPRWQKDLFWMFPVKHKGRKIFVRIPKPFAYGQVFGSIPERFFEYLDSKNPKAFEDIKKSLYDSVSPIPGDPSTGMLATALKPLIENATNWNFFLERNIVPEGRKKLLPELQYTKYTTETAKEASKMLKDLPDISVIKEIKSPAKLENLLRGWFGGSSKYALQASDFILGKMGKKVPQRPKELADKPLAKGFVTRPVEVSSNQQVQDFYRKRDEIQQAYLSYRALIKEGKKAEAAKVKEKYPDYKYYSAANKAAKSLSLIGQQIERIVRMDISEDAKRKRIKPLEKKRMKLVEKMNKLFKRK